MRGFDRFKVIQTVVDRVLKPGPADAFAPDSAQVERSVLRHKQAGADMSESLVGQTLGAYTDGAQNRR